MAKAKATRAAYGETLLELIAEGHDIVAVEADLAGSTTTGKVGEVYPERFFNAGIAEANMVGVAAGHALAGQTAFTGSFAVFGTGRVYDQIRNTVCYNMLDVKIAPTHSGVTVGADGGSHQMLEDIALMRVLPHMRVLVPADYTAAKAAVRYAATNPGPFYVRLGRAEVPAVYGPDGITGVDAPDVTKAFVVREGADVTIAACGIEVAEAIKAAEMLEAEGIDAEIIDVMCIKPLDVETIVRSVSKTGRMVTAEEHSVLGGMGSAVSEVLSEVLPTPTRRVGVADQFGTSGTPDELIKHFSLDAASIAAAAKELL
ncbi:MAG: transketolase family protein [Coriobacteriia bacterium]|nr:transketolase family protein [Coriobacteriia bacterium]MCL2537110.1 transketolase family protein [Coriobacteriia bacterium]